MGSVEVKKINNINVNIANLDTPLSGIKSGTDKIPSDPARENGNLATLTCKDFATETTLEIVKTKTDNIDIPASEILAELQEKTKPSDIQNNELINVLRNILNAIANPSYVDKSANAIRNQVQSGTVTTVTGLTNIDSYQGKLLMINSNINAWANCCRSRIS